MTRHLTLMTAALAATAAFAADPTVEVTFTDPASFKDLRTSVISTDRERLALAESLRQHLIAAAPRRIPAGSRLAITITDVDMAGELRAPGTRIGHEDVRIVKDIYPPRVDLNFRLLRADGTVEREGKRELRDLTFLMNGSRGRTDTLIFEKELLDHWLEREFAAKR